jgi:hypothetical protein
MSNKVVVRAFFLLTISTLSLYADPILNEMAFNINGTLFEDVTWTGFPEMVTETTIGFDDETGIGKIQLVFSPDDYIAGESYFILSFFDYDLDYDFYEDESVAITGSVEGLTWEVDDSYYVGGLYDVFLDVGYTDNQDLAGFDNTIFGAASADGSSILGDVSLAMGWNFTLDDGESAIITYAFSETEPVPGNGFLVTHTNSETQDVLYYTTSFSTTSVPEPAIMTMLAMGCLLAGIIAGKRE